MHILITDKAGSIDTLTASLVRNPRAAASMLERIKALNPHLADVRRLEPGTVVILPDAADLKKGVGVPVAGAELADLGGGVRAGLEATERRIGARLEALNADHAAVREALKSAAAKRLIEANPGLRERLKAAEARFKTEQKSVTESRGAHAELGKLVEAEITRLQQIIR